MLKNNSMYYLWHNQLSPPQRKIIFAFLFQNLVEYVIFFALLAHHHMIAMMVFATSNWFPATLYFDLLFSAILGSCFIIFLLVLRYRIVINPAGKVGGFVCYSQFMYLLFLTFGLHFVKTYDLSILFIFILISIVFAIGYACDKVITIGALISIIRNNKSAYVFFGQCYFFTLSVGLIVASFLNKFSNAKINHLSIKPIVMGLLLVSFIGAIFSHALARYKDQLSISQMRTINLNLFRYKRELIARIGLNILIGAFLVKWYFTMPLFLQYSENWNTKRIANAIFIASLLSLMVNWLFRSKFNKSDPYSSFVYILLILSVTIVFVTANLYYHHWILFCVILMAIFYNSLQSTVNEITHYDIIDIEVNLISLIIGNIVSLVLFSFIISGMSIFISKQVGIHSQPIKMSLLLLSFIVMAIYSFYKLIRYRRKRIDSYGEKHSMLPPVRL